MQRAVDSSHHLSARIRVCAIDRVITGRYRCGLSCDAACSAGQAITVGVIRVYAVIEAMS